jgi:hypothetical protein
VSSLLPIVRKACPEDALAISNLYYEAYMPANCGDPRQYYPFPQFLEPDCVESIVRSGTIRWLVAELGHTIIGTCGAVVNIGDQDDKVAEGFGLVIDKRWRFKHYGTALFRHLHNSLTATEDAVFIIAETRTSHPGGWKVVQQLDFIPLGFEPFAHATPIGSESMLMTGRILPSALEKRNIYSKTSSKSHYLSIPIFKYLQCESLYVQNSEDTYPLSGNIPLIKLDLLEDSHHFSIPELHESEYTINVFEDKTAKGPPEKLKNLARHKAGIISLKRLEGEDSMGVRYERRYFQAYLNNYPIAYALAVLDHLDHRLRILDLRALFDGVQGVMIQQILQKTIHGTKGNPLTVVVDVRADNAKLHVTLEKLGFFPTIYYPALIADAACRIDAVQFTFLSNLDFEESWISADFRALPLAASVASRVSL